MLSVILKPGREKSLLRRHPWVFSGAMERVDGAVALGETVSVVASDGTPLGLMEEHLLPTGLGADASSALSSEFAGARILPPGITFQSPAAQIPVANLIP